MSLTDLQALLPSNAWIKFSHQIIWHGRRICSARKPDCAACPLPCPSRMV